MESAGLYKVRFSITDQYGGRMACELDLAPFFKAFADFYEKRPPISREKKDEGIEEMVVQLGVPREAAEAAWNQDMARRQAMVAVGLLYFVEMHLPLALEEALNATEQVIGGLACDINNSVESGLKKAIDGVLNEQSKLAKNRLRASRGRNSINPFRLLGDLFEAMRLVTGTGNEITQENVAEKMGYKHTRTLQKQLDAHGIKWATVVSTYQSIQTPELPPN